ncbi:MAG: FAD-dependent oxidoreductase [Thaumarchaeota archaeon]|nr:FAD-dependent oxidoreductase [Nitrososphaerota archaeon]
MVVGAGPAGVSAANAASRLGARVTLFEKSEKFPIEKCLWPLTLCRDTSPEGLGTSHRIESEVDARFGEGVSAVDTTKKSVAVGSRTTVFDSLVVSTGSSVVQDSFPFQRKAGLFRMQDLASFQRLAEVLGDLGRVVVSGSTALALATGDALRQKGIEVTLVHPAGVLASSLGTTARAFLERKLEMGGLKVVRSPIDSVVGVRRVEAIVASGSVQAADALISFPAWGPNPPTIEVRKGSAGGILIDSRMRCSVMGIFGAGDCAEISYRSGSLQMMYRSSAELMGELAGRNAAGSSAEARLSGASVHAFYGTGVCTAGITLADARGYGLDAAETSTGSEEVSEGPEGELLCTLVFERQTGLVLGMQIVGTRAPSYGELSATIVSNRLRIVDLAFQDNPLFALEPSDISPISAAAREGLDK